MQLNKPEVLRQAQQFMDSGRVSSAIRLYQSIIEADPLDLSVVSSLGEVYVKAGRIQDAIEHYLRVAENYLRNGSAISATHILKKVLRLDPVAARAHMHFGELYLNEGRINDAHASFIEAGAAFWHKGNTTAAIKMNELALVSRPDSRQAKTALALLEQEINQPKEPAMPTPVIGEVEQILISIPDEPDAPASLSAAHVSRLQPELLPDTGASPANEESTETDCMSEDAIVEQIAIAELLVGDGHAVQAVALLRETLHYKPDHIQIRAKLKDIYLRTEMIDRASEECLNIAAIYAAQGESSRARDYVRRARVLGNSIGAIASIAGKSPASEEPREEALPWIPQPTESLRLM